MKIFINIVFLIKKRYKYDSINNKVCFLLENRFSRLPNKKYNGILINFYLYSLRALQSYQIK